MLMVPCTFDAELWACGDGGYLAHLDSASMEWVEEASPVSSSLRDIFVASRSEMWASVAAAWRRRAVACARGVGGGRAAGAIAGAAFPLSTQTGTKCDLRAS